MSAWGRESDASAVVRAGADAAASAAPADTGATPGPRAIAATRAGPSGDLVAAEPSPEGRGGWYPAGVWARALGVYGIVLAVLLVVSWQVVARYTEHAPGVPPVEVSGRWFWDGWVRYDAGWYTLIADDGYAYRPGHQSSVAFFPGYPSVVRAVSGLVGNTPLAGILVTIACGAAALVVYHGWCRARLGPQAAWAALLCLALYPYAFYLYGAVYAETLFLLCALVAFAAFERDHLVLAGLAGAAASATRLVGLAVAIGLVVGVAERRGVLRGAGGRRWRERLDLSALRPGDAWVLLAFTGFAGWAVFLWYRYGDPLLFSRVQDAWGQGSGLHTWLKRDFLASVAGIRGDRLFAYGLWAHAAVALAVVLSVPGVARRFGVRYGVYVGVVVGIPLVGSQDFHAMGRYVLVAFPTFALLGAFLADRPALRRVVLPLSAVALVALTVGFANGRYVS
ncbi:MAG TPA: hypothetical protein VFP06_01585 [Acidimicrobiales bacterium]|nr:hypothetical protein [Acidimicrobiales bacterium]